MSLVNTLMNGGTYGVSINAKRYTHSDGASRIAMESTAELHDIFMESFYNVEQAELAAATEGVALEGSQYEAVAEAAAVGAIEKVKNFFKKLWAKVKAFFHEVRRFLDALFLSGADFCKKYEKEINKIGSLKDFSFKMFKYDDAVIDAIESKALLGSCVDELTVKCGIDKIETTVKTKNYPITRDSDEELEADLKAVEKECEYNTVAKRAVDIISGGGCKDPDEFDEWVFGHFRKGATGADDKDDVDISSVDGFAKTLRDSKKSISKLDKMQREVDKAFRDADKRVNELAKTAETYKADIKPRSSIASNAEEERLENIGAVKESNAATLAKVLRLYSSTFSVSNSFCTKYITAWKQVVNEREGVYKQVIMAAFSHKKKQDKKDR